MASVFKQKYTVAGNNGKRICKQSKYWYIDYKTADGTRKRVKGFKDKQATVQLAAKLEKEAELGKAGIFDKYAEQRKRPLKEHLADFKASLEKKGNTVSYVIQTISRIEKAFKQCKFIFWNDITADEVENFLSDLRDNGASDQTSNYYLQSLKAFCKWMVKRKRAGESPLTPLDNRTITNKGKRRALSSDEVRKLLEAKESEPERYNTTGHQRATLYLLAVETGLRASELRSLTVSSFDLNQCTVTVKTEDAKNNKESTLPLREETAVLLKNFLSGKLPGTPAFVMPSKYNMANMLRADLEAAGIDHKDNGEGKIDFHSLRHTTGSLLAASGTHPKVAQSIMRHSDINLTMSRYTHIFRGQESEAIANLPDFSLKNGQRQVSTGTDGKPEGHTESAYKKLTKKSDFNRNQNGANTTNWQTGAENKRLKPDTSKSLKSGQLDTKKEPMSSTDTASKSNTPGRTRTCDLRIRNPLLCPAELRALISLSAFNITTSYRHCQSF